jgi:hypothetical protein
MSDTPTDRILAVSLLRQTRKRPHLAEDPHRGHWRPHYVAAYIDRRIHEFADIPPMLRGAVAASHDLGWPSQPTPTDFP